MSLLLPICSYELPTLNNCDETSSPLEIQRVEFESEDVHGPELCPHFFWNTFLLKNRPCLVKGPARVMKEWPAMRNWVTSSGEINFEYLIDAYRDVQVPVTEITKDISMEYGGMNCTTMSFQNYVQYFLKYRESDYSASMPCLYLKDWHILVNHGNDETGTRTPEKPYETLPIFASDWLNETSSKDDDYRFVYLGPKGSWTPLHADVYGSFSWSVNIAGQKKWHLYPPGNERRFQMSNRQSHPQYNSENAGIEGQDFIEVVQQAGETIFVPSGWFHVVWNVSDVISINHNWFNGANICYIWHQLQNALAEVKQEIAEWTSLKDCAEGFEINDQKQCQLILKANHGMNYSSFCDLILNIWEKRMDRLKDFDDRPEEEERVLLDLAILRHLINHHLLNDVDLASEYKQKFNFAISQQLPRGRCC
ncbi:2-oxoglutarate and iron-dependent oxygenase JMJD4 isoform X1 [Folsomia candida]|uniref:2-oxoglutarate and iron-dependent oxygenase JMJD4 isoform X1 n=1 Tax=Folsomia candida TaxID=158441 RepID=UPI0016052357|nr:2-oxoglutarate and iron-dependent oxygenase JMJD4 isoform X1 [Folsomia candida]